MEQKTNALKSASKVISILMKIGWVAMIVAACLCAAALIFVAVTGGQTSVTTSGGVNLIVADELAASPAELVATSAVYLVMGGFLFAIFLLAQRMFGEISATGDPFLPKYVKTVRVIGILVAAMTFGVGLADAIASSAAPGMQAHPEAPGIVVGAIIFCLSYIIDYGCGLKTQAKSVQK